MSLPQWWLFAGALGCVVSLEIKSSVNHLRAMYARGHTTLYLYALIIFCGAAGGAVFLVLTLLGWLGGKVRK